MHTGNLCVRRARCDCGQDTRSLCVRTDREQIGPGGLREQARHAQPEFSREAAACPPEMETIQVLKSALDQMRHFLWFYMQVMTSGSEMGEKLRQTLRQDPGPLAPETEQQQHMQNASDSIMLRYLADSKFRKPN